MTLALAVLLNAYNVIFTEKCRNFLKIYQFSVIFVCRMLRIHAKPKKKALVFFGCKRILRTFARLSPKWKHQTGFRRKVCTQILSLIVSFLVIIKTIQTCSDTLCKDT